MRIIDINSNEYGVQQVIVDDEDYEFVSNYAMHVWSTPRHHTLYAIITFSRVKQLRLHRVLTKAKDNEVVDHINGNGLDNRRSNLRVTTQLNNNANARKKAKATSMYKGVSLYLDGATSKPWKAQIQRDGRKFHIGYFATEIEAAIAYDNAAKEYFGEFAVLNMMEAK